MYLRPKPYLLYVSLLLTSLAHAGTPPVAPSFNKDILPILQTRCQPCHRPGDLGPMPLVTYEQTKPWAKAIVDVVKSGKMPPWYAEKCCSQFSLEHKLTAEEVATIDAWATGGAIEGKKKEGPRPINWTNDWRIDGPSVVVSLPRAFEVPANAKIETQYVILPIDLADDRWASSVEIHPADRSVVQDAILYIRTKDSGFLRNVPKLTMYAPGPLSPEALAQRDNIEILAVYTTGNPSTVWPEGMGKKLSAGSDLVLQIVYISKKTATTDRTSVGINFLKERPEKRVLTLELQNRALAIPPGTADYQASALGVLPRDVLLLGLFPHMHARGTAFEFAIIQPGGKQESLLNVRQFDSRWQPSYPLKTPRLLPKGTRIVWTGSFDNSAANVRNPDPKAEVHWGHQASDEIMAGYFDVAIDANTVPIGLVNSPKP